MNRRTRTVILAAALWLCADFALAQTAASRSQGNAIAFGVGLDRVGGEGIVQLNGSHRFNLWKTDAERPRQYRPAGRVKGYVEAKLAYWGDSAAVPYD